MGIYNERKKKTLCAPSRGNPQPREKQCRQCNLKTQRSNGWDWFWAAMLFFLFLLSFFSFSFPFSSFSFFIIKKTVECLGIQKIIAMQCMQQSNLGRELVLNSNNQQLYPTPYLLVSHFNVESRKPNLLIQSTLPRNGFFFPPK